MNTMFKNSLFGRSVVAVASVCVFFFYCLTCNVGATCGSVLAAIAYMLVAVSI